ncbi:hypothetical protein ASG90_17175 [Nocardioides sp. Soil797]|nr:hypothetical protein ASG90_17175 [Nocardioides sp. Soil797]
MNLAHGVGGAQDLPIPASFAALGAGVALAVSFAVLAVAWRQPRFSGATHGVPLSQGVTGILHSRVTLTALRAAGMTMFAYVIWIAVWGPDLATNPIFGIIYVLLWVGLVPASLILGPIWRTMNPARTVHDAIARVAGPSIREGVFRLPDWVGYWPASVGLFTFVWMELVYESGTYLAPVRLWMAVYFVVVVLGSLLWGERWISRADPLEAYSTLVSHLSPVGRNSDGRLVLQNPMDHLDGFTPSPSRLVLISVLLGSTAYDSFSRSLNWLAFVDWVGIDSSLLGTLTLFGFCSFVAVTFAAAAMLSELPDKTKRVALPGLYVHSVIPIVVGYVIAHYISLLLEYGQQVVIQLSDPMVNGANIFGTAELQVNYFLSNNPSVLAMLKVLAVVTGHIAGAIAAHDRATKLLPAHHRVAGQLAMMVVMVIYTTGGLFLLFSG